MNLVKQQQEYGDMMVVLQDKFKEKLVGHNLDQHQIGDWLFEMRCTDIDKFVYLVNGVETERAVWGEAKKMAEERVRKVNEKKAFELLAKTQEINPEKE